MSFPALPILALLSSCHYADEKVTEGPKTPAPAGSGVEDPPDPAPVVDERKSREEYIDGIVCGREGQGLFGRTPFKDLYHLGGTVFYTTPEGTPAMAPHFWVLRIGERTDPENPRTLGDWVGGKFQIVAGTPHSVTVMNECGYEETIPLDTFGSKRVVEKEESWEEDDEGANRFKAKEDWLDDAAANTHGYVIHEGRTDDGARFTVSEDGTITLYRVMLDDPEGGEMPVTKFRWDPVTGNFEGYGNQALDATEEGEWTSSGFEAKALAEIEEALGATIPDEVKEEITER